MTVRIFLATVVGTFSLIAKMLRLLHHIRQHFLRCERNCYKKYAGTDSWVLVTGGSDGIGLEMCKQMAAQGFNVCIVARNEEKIKSKIPEILECNKNIKTRYVIADFA